MLNWIKGFVGRWAGAVDQAVRDLVHWTVHALASVMYAVFGLVGRAWHNVFAAANWLREQADHLGREVFTTLWSIIKRDLPWLASALVAVRNFALRLYHTLLAWAWREIQAAEQLARRLVDDLRQWAYRDIWLPLLHLAADARRDIQRWAWPAFWYITHPDALAGLIGDALVSWLEANAWRVGRRLGTFLLALLVHNLRQVLALVEDVLSAVL